MDFGTDQSSSDDKSDGIELDKVAGASVFSIVTKIRENHFVMIFNMVFSYKY